MGWKCTASENKNPRFCSPESISYPPDRRGWISGPTLLYFCEGPLPFNVFGLSPGPQLTSWSQGLSGLLIYNDSRSSSVLILPVSPLGDTGKPTSEGAASGPIGIIVQEHIILGDVFWGIISQILCIRVLMHMGVADTCVTMFPYVEFCLQIFMNLCACVSFHKYIYH